MSKLTDLMREYKVLTQMDYPERRSFNVSELAMYGKVESHDNWRTKQPEYAYINCDTKCTDGSHSIYAINHHKLGPAWAYRWAGQSYLVSKQLLPIDVLHKLSALKEADLAEARKKRFETVKSARDAVRVLFRDLNIEHEIVGGSPRVDCGPFNLEFEGDKESPSVKVSMVYRDYYLNKIELIDLTVADPSFNDKIQALVHNGMNLNKLMLGEMQPEAVRKS